MHIHNARLILIQIRLSSYGSIVLYTLHTIRVKLRSWSRCITVFTLEQTNAGISLDFSNDTFLSLLYTTKTGLNFPNEHKLIL